MIRIAITAEAFEAIAATLPSGNVLYERERTPQGGISSGSSGPRSTTWKGCAGRATRTSAPSSSGCSASMRPTSRSSNSWTSSTGE